MKNTVHLLRSYKASELTAKQALALKPWLAKRYQDDCDATQWKSGESRATPAALQLPGSSILNSQSANVGPIGGSDGFEQLPSSHARKLSWSPPPLSSSESDDDDQYPVVASTDTPAPNQAARQLPSPPRLTLPKVKEAFQGSPSSATKSARAAKVARKREPQLAGPNASVTGGDPRRSASLVRSILLTSFGMLREYTGGH